MIKSFHYIYNLSRCHIPALLLLLLLGGVDVFLSLAIVGVSKRLIDIATGAYQGDLWQTIGLCGGMMFLSIIIRGISSLWTTRMQTEVRNRLNSYFFSRIIRAGWQRIQAFHSGDIMSRVDTDIRDMTALITVTIPQFILTSLKLSGAFCFLFMMDRKLAYLLAGLIPVVLLFSKLYFKKMRRLSNEIKEAWSKVWQFFQESVQHIEITKALRLESLFERYLDDRNQGYARIIMRQSGFSFYSNLVLALGFTVGYLLTFSWGLFQLQAGVITFGTMTAFLQLVNMIQGPALGLVSLAPGFVAAYTAGERLNELEQGETEQEGEPCYLPDLKYLRFSEVSYSYQPDIPLLENVCLLFEQGKMYALTGKTGCGKTTIIRLMLAFIRPRKGTIVLSDGKYVYPLDEQTRINFTYVPQDNYLLSGTIRENLKVGKPEATDDELNRVLLQSASGFVYEKPDGLDTLLNESGGGLSGGQIQRLAIARALLCPGSILLLDEITSSLDNDTEYEIIESLKKHVKDKIIIIVSHKQKVIAACDYTYRF